MKIAGKSVDFEGILEMAIMESVKDIRRCRNLCDPSGKAMTMIVDRCCAYILTVLNAMTPNGKTIKAEKAIAELMRRGFRGEAITYRTNHYIIRINGHDHHIKRTLEGFGFRPDQDYSTMMFPIFGLDEKEFADFLIQFDELYDKMKEAARILLQMDSNNRQREKKEAISFDIQRIMVHSLIQEYISPFGLEADFKLLNGNVKLTVSRKVEAHFDVPIEKLAELLKDTNSVMKALQPKW